MINPMRKIFDYPPSRGHSVVRECVGIALEGLTVEADRVRAAQQARRACDRPGRAGADGCPSAKFAFGIPDELRVREKRCAAIAPRRRYPAPQKLVTLAIECDDFDLSAAEIDAQPHAIAIRGNSRRVSGIRPPGFQAHFLQNVRRSRPKRQEHPVDFIPDVRKFGTFFRRHGHENHSPARNVTE